MKKVTIERKNWSRGALAANALLVASKTLKKAKEYISVFDDRNLPIKGQMCCLGFVCLALDVPKKKLVDKELPSDLEQYIPKLTDKDFTNTSFTWNATQINDNQNITEKQREQELKKLAKQAGFTFKFVD